MRHKIWRKDDFFQVGGHRTDMDPTVVDISEERIGLVWGYDFNKIPPYGWITDIRCEDGEITGEVEWVDQPYDQMIEDGDIYVGGYYIGVETRREGEIPIVTKCKLQGASMVVMSSMPGYPRDKT